MNDNLNDNQTVNNENTIVNNQEFEQIEQKPPKKNNSTMKIVIIMAVIILAIITLDLLTSKKTEQKGNKNKTKEERTELTDMIETLPFGEEYSSATYHNPNNYFNYKDKLYFYERKNKQNYLYVMNMDGSNKKILSKDEQLLFPSFYLVYKDEAYFYCIEGFYLDLEPKTNYKVNLNTGVVTSLNNSYRFLPYTFKDGKIFGNASDVYKDYAYRLYNLNTNKIDYENTYVYDYRRSYLYDYSNGDIYSITQNTIKNSESKKVEIYKNNKKIKELTIDKTRKYEIRLLYANNNELYLYYENKLFKFDVNTKKLTTSETDALINHKIINSNNLNNLYIYNKNDYYLYILDKENNTFKKLFKVVGEYGQNKEFYSNDPIIETESKIILPADGNTLKYVTEVDNIGVLNVYDKNTEKVELTKNVRRTFYDYENNILYLYIKGDVNYTSKKIDLNNF